LIQAEKYPPRKSGGYFFSCKGVCLQTTLLLFSNYLNFANSFSFSYLVPVNEVNKAEIAKREVTLVKNDGFASAEDGGAEMSVGVKAALGLFIGEGESKLNMLGTGMMILTLGSAGGEYSFHSLDKVYLKEFSTEVVGVVGAFLDHYRTGGVMRVNNTDTVLDAGFLNDLLNVVGNVVEAGHMVPGLKFNSASVNCHFNYLLLILIL
jgi:hypothetical protein